MIRALAAGLVLAGGVALANAPAAAASPNSFLADLSQHGMILLDPAIAVNDGYFACIELREGYSVYQVANHIQARNPYLVYSDAVYEVGAAWRHLC
jgi:hypothetical protein